MEEITKVKEDGKGNFRWYVTWKGYRGSQSKTWEPLEHLKNAKGHLVKFYHCYPNEKRPKGLQLCLSVFPREIFPDHFWTPLTTGVDTSIPSPADYRRMERETATLSEEDLFTMELRALRDARA